MYLQRNIKARLQMIVAVEKQKTLHPCACVSALVRACAQARVHTRACM
jgi:hypothetical protein